MNHATIIADLGGPVAVGRFLHLKYNAATHWGRLGIPAKYWVPLSKMKRPDGRRGFTAEEIADAPKVAA